MTPLYPQKLALTSPTGGGRSVGIVRSRTKATEFSLVLLLKTDLTLDVWSSMATPPLTFREKAKEECEFC